MPDAILALNAGSSSIKFALDAREAGELRIVARGQIEGIGAATHFLALDPAGAALAERSWGATERPAYEALVDALLGWVGDHLEGGALAAVGHRVVHGGTTYVAPVLVDDGVMEALDALTPLAPLHQPHSLAPIRTVRALRPGLPQVACFDTAFHHSMPAVATRFALPRHYEAAGLRRYGFHGLSYEFVAGRLRELSPSMAGGRVIAAHLGNGASLCAMHAGRSVDTTMGLTALDGLVMGTRCGTLDPGAVLYLQRRHGHGVDEVEDLLYRRSGLLGVSGISGDMRVLLASEDERAREAIELFVFRIAQQTAALAGSLGGLDGLVFTGGIGEHAAPVREAVCRRLAWLGVELDDAANAGGHGLISTASSRVEVRVIPTDEEAMIVRHTLAVTGARACSVLVDSVR